MADNGAMSVQLELSTVVDAPIERVFDLSRRVDFHEASMRASGEQAIRIERSDASRGVNGAIDPLGLGDCVTWRARHFGVWWRLRSHITACQRPFRFVDEQLTGPFAHWYHEHLFAWDERLQATVMRDVIRFAAPARAVGWAAERLVLRRYMRALIVRRNAYLARQLNPD
jgi:ligand-binding SRPBCC domain-containing protein